MITPSQALKALVDAIEGAASEGLHLSLTVEAFRNAKAVLQAEENNRLFKENKIEVIVVANRMSNPRHRMAVVSVYHYGRSEFVDCESTISPVTGMSPPCPHGIVFRWKDLP